MKDPKSIGYREWTVWCSMKQRCSNPKAVQFANYGGRGIQVCQRWMKFDNFLADMGFRPSREHSLDRIDNSKGYSPDNCRWATHQEQQRNIRTNVRVTFQGLDLTVAEWSAKTGIPASALYQRFDEGWDAARALTTAPRTSWRKRGPVSDNHRAALRAGQRRRWGTDKYSNLIVK